MGIGQWDHGQAVKGLQNETAGITSRGLKVGKRVRFVHDPKTTGTIRKIDGHSIYLEGHSGAFSPRALEAVES